MISSLQNSRIKHFKKLLEKNSYRKEQGEFFVEGAREILAAWRQGFPLATLGICEEYLDAPGHALIAEITFSQPLLVSTAVFDALVMRKASLGVFAIFRPKPTDLNALTQLAQQTSQSPLLIVVSELEKPGNLGAILRTAAAIGVTGCVSLGTHVDFFHPHVIRASLGGVFLLPVVTLAPEALADFCQDYSIRLYAACLSSEAVPYTQVDWRTPAALLVGSEANGLPAEHLRLAQYQVIIPMPAGQVDSLNVSVATAVILCEAVRQRCL